MFKSKVNQVELQNNNYGLCIQKIYRERSRELNIYLPINRAEVERNIYIHLSNLTNKFLKLPIIYKFEESVPLLLLEYINANTIKHMIENNTAHKLFNTDMWKAFYSLFSELRKISYSEYIQIIGFDNADSQREIRSIMYEIKIGHQKQSDDFNMPACLCLGDVSINNIICHGDAIILIDFECAHWGYEGYDVGQFLAMCDIVCNLNDEKQLYNFIYSIMLDITTDLTYLKNIQWWKEKLTSYYYKELALNHKQENC